MPEPASVGTSLRIWLVGFGTVGKWLARALDSQAQRLARDYGVRVTVVGLANARDGFIYLFDTVSERIDSDQAIRAARYGTGAEQKRAAG